MPRAPTFGDRNEENKRTDTPPRGIGLTNPAHLGVPHEIAEPATGVVKGAALDKIRADRDPVDALAHHDRRLDEHAARIASLEIADAHIESKVDTTNALLIGHTAILGSQSSQLDRLLNEDSAKRVTRNAAHAERGTEIYKTVMGWLKPIGAAVVAWILARGC